MKVGIGYVNEQNAAYSGQEAARQALQADVGSVYRLRWTGVLVVLTTEHTRHNLEHQISDTTIKKGEIWEKQQS